jgi:hypothetical protein
MGLALVLAREARIDLREIGGLALVALADTQVFLDACATEGVLVLGVEGFYLHGPEARPEMDAIADFSEVDDAARSVREARAFIATVGRPGMLFDFALSPGVAT